MLDRHIPDWRQDNAGLRHALGIPKVELWEAHSSAKDELIKRVNETTGAKSPERRAMEPFVNGGTLATSSAFTDGKLSGTLYRFVTWVADPCPTCANSQDYKRVTVVLTTPGTASPFITSTIVSK